MMTLIKDLNIKGIESIRVTNTSNKELYSLRKQVKIDAAKAAKEKAQYLLESIGENVGKAISIEEMQDNTNSNTYNYFYRREMLSNVQKTAYNAGNEIDHIASIKLRCEIKSVFEIE